MVGMMLAHLGVAAFILGVTIVGVKRANEDFQHALPDTRIRSADLLIVSGPTKKIEEFAAGQRKGR